MDYTVTVELSITANSPEQAARYALDDLRDTSIGPWEMDVSCARGTKVVSTGDPYEDDSIGLDVTYLTNASGEDTGHGTIKLQKSEYAKVGFEQGPGRVIQYIVEIAQVPYVLGSLEVACNNPADREDQQCKAVDEIRNYCNAASEYIRSRLKGEMLLLPLDEGDLEFIAIQVAIPLHALRDREATSLALRDAFGEMTELPDEVPAI